MFIQAANSGCINPEITKKNISFKIDQISMDKTPNANKVIFPVDDSYTGNLIKK